MIYVDNIRKTKPVNFTGGRWRWKHYCHLFGDDIGELHVFAAGIGLKPNYFRDFKEFPHYDLTKNMRLLALRAGAREIPLSEWLISTSPQLLISNRQ